MLCQSCDGKLSNYESKAKDYFVDNKPISYDDLLKFFLSIVIKEEWRKQNRDKELINFIKDYIDNDIEKDRFKFTFFGCEGEHLIKNIAAQKTKKHLLECASLFMLDYLIIIKINEHNDPGFNKEESSFREDSISFKQNRQNTITRDIVEEIFEFNSTLSRLHPPDHRRNQQLPDFLL